MASGCSSGVFLTLFEDVHSVGMEAVFLMWGSGEYKEIKSLKNQKCLSFGSALPFLAHMTGKIVLPC